MQTFKILIALMASVMLSAVFAFALVAGTWIYSVKRDVRACVEFWNEPCVIQPVPKSISSNFSVSDYNKQQNELENN